MSERENIKLAFGIIGNAMNTKINEYKRLYTELQRNSARFLHLISTAKTATELAELRQLKRTMDENEIHRNKLFDEITKNSNSMTSLHRASINRSNRSKGGKTRKNKKTAKRR